MTSNTLLEEIKDTVTPPPSHSDTEPPVLRTSVDPQNVALVVIAVLATLFALQWAKQILIPLVLGILITYSLGPIVTWLEKWKIRRAIGAAILLIGITSGVSYLTYSLADDAAEVLEALPEAAKKIGRSLQGESKREGTIDKVQKAAVEIERATTQASGDNPSQPKGVTRVEIAQPKFNIRDYLWIGSMGAAALAGQAVLLFFLVYFLLVSGDLFKRKLVKITGPTLTKKKVTVEIINEINTQIERYLLVQLFTSTVVGLATWAAFALIGLEHAALWGLTAGMLNMVPYVGPVIVTGGATLAGFLQFGTIGEGLFVGGVSLVISSLEGFLLTPWMTSRAGRINAVAIFIGLLFWGWLWGVWGVLLGIPIIMVIKSICDRIEDLNPIGELLGD